MGQFIDWIRILYWSIGLLIFTALTIRDIIPLVYEFENNNVGTSMKIVANDRTTKPPSLAFRIPRSRNSLKRVAENVCSDNESRLMLECHECRELSEHGWDVWNQMNLSDKDSIPDCFNLISVIMGRKVLNDSKEALNVSNLNWSLPVLDAAWDLLDCINSLDLEVDFGIAWTKWDLCYGQHDIDLALSTKRVDDIHDSIVGILCDYVSFSSGPGGDNCSRILGKALGVLYSNAYTVQLNLQDNIQFSVNFNFTNPRNVPWPGVETGGIFTIDEDLNMVTLSNGIGKTVFPFDPMTTPNISRVVNLKYSIANVIIGKSLDRTPCYNDSNPIVCQASCVLRKVAGICHCIPFTFRKNIVSINKDFLPYCTIDSYSKCQLNKTTEKENCDAQCSNPCEYLTYNWHITNSASKDGLQGRIYLAISPIPTPFIEFRSVIKNSDEQFFSQVAAIFNLYLGFSGISVISGILLGADVIRKWYLIRRQRSNQIGAGEIGPEDLENKDSVSRVTKNEPTPTADDFNINELLASMNLQREEFQNMIARMEKLEQRVDAMRFRRKIHAE